MASLPPITATLIDAIEEPTLIIDRQRVVAVNRAARSLVGVDAIGRDVRLAIRHPEALDLILGPSPEGSREIVGIGGVERPWALTVNDLGEGRRLIRLIDRGEARAAERQRVDFVANASHELRTPLATIVGYGETLADEDPLDDELRRRFGHTILGEARRMLRLIEELMGLSRIEAGRFQHPTDPVDLAAVIETAVSDTGELARQRGARVLVEAEPLVVAGDRSQLVQLVNNLVSNALRYACPKPGGEVRLHLAHAGGMARLDVADDGEGIAADHLPRLTERFYRVDAARSRDSGGTGLGLAIVKHIVERHRGTLDIASRPGRGTIVTVRLPLLAGA
ncbi:ATP-binding protein [Sphingomonas sp. ASV193]|uniref:ATP-binding protein n=1 Tax=Sphingomonas sp. ASV193 TaxID=3144405 RepID=UPI0032E87D4A